ncbi:MAG: hypothetical protein RI947_1159 [Candidatus Parcubacteria bacterium]|jgi:mannosyl-3-phosphoglycerate phosphatase family protein
MKNSIRTLSGNIAIYTDLDGTLLDEHGSIESVKSSIEIIKQAQLPLIFVTSKTYAEIEVLHTHLGMWGRMPFIVENGGAIYIPSSLFDAKMVSQSTGYKPTIDEHFLKITLGESYNTVRTALFQAAAKAGYNVKGIGDMSVDEFASYTGLSHDLAARAKQREYQEGYLIEKVDDKTAAYLRMEQCIRELGFDSTAGGGFYHIMKGGSKAKAVAMLQKLYKHINPSLRSIGFGDAMSDIEFLDVCDEGYLVTNPAKIRDVSEIPPGIVKMKESGPVAFNNVIHATLYEDRTNRHSN